MGRRMGPDTQAQTRRWQPPNPGTQNRAITALATLLSRKLARQTCKPMDTTSPQGAQGGSGNRTRRCPPHVGGTTGPYGTHIIVASLLVVELVAREA